MVCDGVRRLWTSSISVKIVHSIAFPEHTQNPQWIKDSLLAYNACLKYISKWVFIKRQQNDLIYVFLSSGL